ncbi:hypothetical protein [Microbacterium sp. MYb66]|uniref:hypothetical protein n=1 Tax=Microbacterium sp. MYb66 TaxID=1848692 RepID=UPI000CFF0315|nr:hypothetical protein [Microbacterium sp. MYb66]PRA82993.1 hypothetical protein CQ045_00905 [Microbacterium sp. MYb66]
MSRKEEPIDPDVRERLRSIMVAQVGAERRIADTRGRLARRRVLGGTAIVVGLVAAVGIGWSAGSRDTADLADGPETRTVDVICADTIAAGGAGPESEVSGASAQRMGVVFTVTVHGSSPTSPEFIEPCARLWRSGALPLFEFQNAGPQAGTEGVPPLAVCGLDGGTPVVMPSSDCRSVGMRDWTDAEGSLPQP